MRTTEELIRRFKNGDRKAFAEIYERFKGRVYSLAYRLLLGAAEAEDVSQEAFTRAYRYIRSFDDHLSFEAWLSRIVYNLCLDLRRNFLRDQERIAGYLREREPSKNNSELSLGDEEALQNYLAQLDDEDRAIVTLYYLEDHTYEEVSQILQIPMGTVKSRLSRARDKLREIARVKANK